MYQMKSYPIISIEKKYCNNTKPNYLVKLRTCTECGKLPLPSYKSSSKHNNTYCKLCYDKQNYDPDSFIENINEDFFLEKLVITCKFKEEGCIKTLQYLEI